MLDVGRRADACAAVQNVLNQSDVPAAMRADAHRLMGEIELDRRNYRQARRQFAAALRQEPDRAEGYHSYAMAVEADPDAHPRQAWVALRRATRLDPLEPRYWSALGHVGLRLGRRHSALKAFRRAVRLRPCRPSTLAAVIDGLTELNRWREARALLMAARFRAPCDKAVQQLWAGFQLACLRRRQECARNRGESDPPAVLPFTRGTTGSLDASPLPGIIRVDRHSRPAPHLFRLAGYPSDPRRAH
jgi:predicted Zn-dependent protease